MADSATANDCTQMVVRVLGAVAVVVDGEDRPLSRQSRRLLARLALADGAPVTLDALAAVVDPDGRPRPSSVRMAVSRLRHLLDGRLARGVDGYRLALAERDRLDLDRFAGSLSGTLAATGVDRIDQLKLALGMWTGLPVAEFADEEWVQRVATHWEEQRRVAVEELAAALLDAGRANETVALLDGELADLPYRERPVELQMRALNACGRLTDALRTYARFRTVLAAEVGVEPSSRLRAVERALLGGTDVPSTVLTEPLRARPPATSFVGRDREVDDVRRALAEHRLVTLTGAGGVGKTRLALQVAATSDDGTDLVTVELAPITDPAALAAAVADGIGVMVHPGSSVADSIVAALSRRRVLIVLDNCEHVIDAAAALVEAIIAGTTDARFLATSRQLLGVAGEQRWPVEPLEPDAARHLFVDRAGRVLPSFAAGDDVLAEICRRLDGIPLAIELAAARVLALTADDIATRLDDRFRLLVGGRRGPERHRTLGSAIGWSFDLLDDRERDVLCACSVFAGGFDLAAATAITAMGDEFDVLDVLESLAGKSLVVVQRTQEGSRFAMLETIRQFAAAQPMSISELRGRHACHYAAVARRGVFVENELDNLRAAFEWTLRLGDVDTAAAIAADSSVCAWRFCRFEPIAWVDEVIGPAAERRSVVLARLHMAASQCTWLGEPDRALAHVARVRQLLADPAMEPVDLVDLRAREATAHLFAGRVEHAVQLDAELAADGGEARLFGLCGLLYDLPELGRFEEAQVIVDEALAAARASGSPFFLCWALTGAARTLAPVDSAAALAAAHEALAVSRADGIRVAEVVIARDVAALEASFGDRPVATEMFLMVLQAFHRAGDWVNLTVTFGELARHFVVSRPEVAATLFGAAGTDGSVRQVRGRAETQLRLRESLGPTRFDQLVRTGATMTRSDSVEYAEEQLRGD